MSPDRRIASSGVVTASATTDSSGSEIPAGSSSGTGHSPWLGTVTWVAKPPWPWLPGMNCRRQIVGRPAAQASQAPQGTTVGKVSSGG